MPGRSIVSGCPCSLLILLSALAVPGFGSEMLHLSTGFVLEAKSHAQIDDKLVLATATGSLELLTADVVQVEYVPDPDLPKEAARKTGDSRTSPDDLIRAAAANQGDAPEFLRFVQSVAWVESGYRSGAISPKGAVGIMQLMPATAKDLGVIPADPRQNAEGGARYLRQLLERYRNDSVLALAAYNAGPAAVQKFGGIPPYAETREYVRKVLREYAKSAAPGPPRASLAQRTAASVPTGGK